MSRRTLDALGMPVNPFDEVLGLEEQFYDDGYQQGLADGVKAGQIEGRTFGLEKGFEKYAESGRLHGKALIWANRTPHFQTKSGPVSEQLSRTENIATPEKQPTQ